MKALRIWMLLGPAVMASAVFAQELKPASYFSDHVVLQQGLKVPVWGTAQPGEKVTVRFAGQGKTATTDDKGNWRVELDPLMAEPGQPGAVMTIAGQGKTIEIQDVLVGEVWFGGGQSNMVGATPIPADFPKQIRLYGQWIGDTWMASHLVAKGKEAQFSRRMVFTGLALHKELKVPVGLLSMGAGATSASGCMRMHFAPFAVRGTLWDQGESGPVPWGPAMREVISNWRAWWGRPDQPLIIIQKPSGGGSAADWDARVKEEVGKFAGLPTALPPVRSP